MATPDKSKRDEEKRKAHEERLSETPGFEVERGEEEEDEEEDEPDSANSK
jgi:hypothetical protein